MFKQLIPDSGLPQPRRQYRPKISLSITLIILLVLGLQFLVLPRYVYKISPSQQSLNSFHLVKLDARLEQCREILTPPIKYGVTSAGSRTNPRWNPSTGQKETTVLQNATLFDGEQILTGKFDITFKKGLIESVVTAGSASIASDAKVMDLEGGFVTPGLVDMHSHHLAFAWPLLSSTDDTNEVHDRTEPITSQVRIIDSLKAYDPGTAIIASGGVTTSLILPGSANIMGGEAVLVKNMLNSGEDSEIVVEDLLLEHGIPKSERRRYMKMACGENPRRVYHHTRMGNAWWFRKHMERAKELKERQDAFCLEAAAVRNNGDTAAMSEFMHRLSQEESATEMLEYDSTIAMLRGKMGINVHCYEPEDFEDMLMHSKEFGFRIQAFHHALEAWQVPEMIKASGENITIATFASFALYKQEAYNANLYAGKILADHGVPVAYKSDHVETETNAKFLLFQAATAHSFGLAQDLALQSVTSVPAGSMEIDHRVGYVKPGYDADIVLWDSHPLSVGATPLQVFIDGRATLDPEIVESSRTAVQSSNTRKTATPSIRANPSDQNKDSLCTEIGKSAAKITIQGITKSYLDIPSIEANGDKGLTMVIEGGRISCFDTEDQCLSVSANSTVIRLRDAHVLPGLTAVSVSLGLGEIATDDSTGDGAASSGGLDLESTIYAKYGVHLDGKSFARARIGGVTRAITAPKSRGFQGGVSVAIKTSGKKNTLNGGLVKDEVALHFKVGSASKSDKLPTISSAVAKLRQFLAESKAKDDIFGRAANGSIPLVVHVENEYDIMSLIKIKQERPALDLVIMGGGGAHLVADEIASANISVILTENRGAPDTFEKINTLPGPPLSKMAAEVLANAGVKFGLAIEGESDSHIHNLPLEAAWAAKYAGLSSNDAINLVSRNIEQILSLDVKEDSRDFVIYEGNPLEFGASVVLSIDGDDGMVATCWPEAT
ncbi:composite domain of metallo-dependent hydrolase [Mollisia scopiformis]|uniref:Composite domain of metallo-dependent hydrolase n=1 Tax=Mollisia scopiformis TaxID=149040 RepID=A0A132B4U8_MOLSC|nr:composite domain of metallo-dependent hydrolase [Mollisia scopiformis]KUJ07432.1 composite domain of metallo-dependent hydrolase [Mollisia scopiformis]